MLSNLVHTFFMFTMFSGLYLGIYLAVFDIVNKLNDPNHSMCPAYLFIGALCTILTFAILHEIKDNKFYVKERTITYYINSYKGHKCEVKEVVERDIDWEQEKKETSKRDIKTP